MTGGRASYFTGARIYWSSTTGARTLRGPILTKYLAAGGPGGYGLPTTDVVNVTGGAYTHFTGTRSIFWSAATAGAPRLRPDPHEVRRPRLPTLVPALPDDRPPHHHDRIPQQLHRRVHHLQHDDKATVNRC